MTTAQNYSAAGMATVRDWTPTERTAPVDIEVQLGVNSKVEIPVTPVIARVIQLMADIRRSGKCGMFVARWDGQAWCFHVCEPPCRINET